MSRFPPAAERSGDQLIGTRRNHLVLVSVLIVVIASFFVLHAQEGAPAGFELWTLLSVARQMAEMATEAPSDPHKFTVRQLADFPNDSVLLVHRTGEGGSRMARAASRRLLCTIRFGNSPAGRQAG